MPKLDDEYVVTLNRRYLLGEMSMQDVVQKVARDTAARCVEICNEISSWNKQETEAIRKEFQIND